MSNKRMDMILEGIREQKVNESVASFAEFRGYALIKDLGDVKKGTLFYCKGFDKNTVTLYKQDDKNYTIKLPTSFAKDIFGDVSMLERGKTYTLKVDLPYERAEEMLGWVDANAKWISKFTKKFKGEDWVVFPKGTKFKYTGEDMAGDYFDVDGEKVTIGSVLDLDFVLGKPIKGYEDIFKM